MLISMLNKDFDLSQFTYRDFGFGKPTELEQFDWCLELDIDNFLTLLTPIYNECVIELIADDKLTGEFSPPFSGATKYPELKYFVLSKFDDFIVFFKTYFVEDFLSEITQGASNWKYVINSIDELLLIDNKIVFKGQAYEKQ